MNTTKRKLLEFKANPSNPKRSPRENRRKDLLHYFTQGEAINGAHALAGVVHHAFGQWHVRHEGFSEVVATAREAHRRDILCGFHSAGSTPIAADSAAQPQRENPDKPDKPLQPNSAANPMRNQQPTPTKTPHEGLAEFFRNPDKTHPAQIHSGQTQSTSESPAPPPTGATASALPVAPSTSPPETALSQTWKSHRLERHPSRSACICAGHATFHSLSR